MLIFICAGHLLLDDWGCRVSWWLRWLGSERLNSMGRSLLPDVHGYRVSRIESVRMCTRRGWFFVSRVIFSLAILFVLMLLLLLFIFLFLVFFWGGGGEGFSLLRIVFTYRWSMCYLVN